MPKQSALYAVSRVRALEKTLISRDKMARLAEGTANDAVRQLVEGGYGTLPDADAGAIDRLIQSELARVQALVRDITPDEELTGLFLIKEDVNNLKQLLKLRFLGAMDEPSLAYGGLFGSEEISKMVKNSEYSKLPRELEETLVSLEKRFASERVDPQKISVSLDRAYISYVWSTLSGHPSDFARDYFTALVDFTNVIILFRIKAMGLTVAELDEFLLPGGDIKHSELVKAWDISNDALARTLAIGNAKTAIFEGLSECAKENSAVPLEKARDNYLMSLIKRHKNEIDTVYPVIGYLLAKEQEARSIRLIVTVKRNGLEQRVIEERLRELYG